MKFLIPLLLCINFAYADTVTIVISRHAEKERGRDPDLTRAGKYRAKSLIELSKMFRFSAAYATTYKRTIQTATPLADKLSINVNTSIGPTDYPALIRDITKNHMNKTVLVVGHSNTVARFLNHLNPTLGLNDIDENDYTNLFIVQYELAGKARVHRYHYSPLNRGQNIELIPRDL